MKATSPPASTCQNNMDARKPWSKANKSERKDFLQAINCTFSKPGHFTYQDVQSKNLLEDYAMTHNFLAPFSK
jgi:hypothetical protein